VIHECGLAYKHDTNGMAERMIRTIEEKLRHYVGAGLRDWDKLLSQIQAGLNSHESWGPKQSPFFLNWGKERRVELQGDVLGELDHLPEAEPAQRDHGLWREIEQQEIEREGRLENERSQNLMKEKGGKSKWMPKIGSWVMVSRPFELRKSKLEPPNDGPFVVTAIDERNNCMLGDPHGEMFDLQTVPMRRLSKFRGKPQERQRFLPSEGVDLEEMKSHPSKKVKKVAKMIEKHFGIPKSVPAEKMMGIRVEVYWTSPGARGWWKGTLVGYDPQRKTFRVKYDTASKDGKDTYEEYLLSPVAPQWKFI
jgi:hypothetical protein